MPEATREDLDGLGIGTKVRELRQKRRYTLQDLSARTGVSKEILAQLEGGEVMPPVATLLRVARGLDVNVAYFLHPGTEEVERKAAVTRVAERRQIARRSHHDPGQIGYTYESVELHKTRKHMEPFLVTFQPVEKRDMVFYSHEGEECVFLLEGELEFRTAEEVTRLREGDCLYFESDMAHAFRSLGDAPAKALIVVYAAEKG
ncbi:MAG: helix-turn-helix transcriptional regulator [Deltaproteobacteria bacterium]|nr:helix-turn-helix transcriptional regulator [Deltaproteobacteria bacterium]